MDAADQAPAEHPQDAPCRLGRRLVERLAWRDDWTETDRRIRILQSVPTVVRFLSAEPLLEAITPDLDGVHWVIVGGESGPQRRPIDLAWMRLLRDQCLAANVAVFIKQVDGKAPIPPDLMVR